MASGRREMVFNTQERAISVDLNRAQKFANQDLQEMLRLAWDVTGSDDLDAGGVMNVTTGITSPLKAEVINGLMVKPQIGTQFCTFEGGVLMAIAPDTGVDDSAYKYVRHIETGETVLVGANASGFTRVDVIECRPSPTQSQVSDSRDVFNPSTGLFSAAQVVKETKGFLEFRLRQGTAGAGFPGTVAGWLPLAVASVPNGSVNNDTVTFWDVRPLMNDREFGPNALASDMPLPPETTGFIQQDQVAFVSQLNGHTRAFLNGRRLGGRLRRGSPGTDSDFTILSDTANIDPTFIAATQQLAYLYLCTPFSLPRWARYTDAVTGLRKPRSPRGILLTSLVPPSNTGRPTAGIQFPAVFGFGSATTLDATCIASTLMYPGGGFYGASFNDRIHQPGAPIGINAIVGVATVGNEKKYTVQYGVHIPPNAKGMLCQVEYHSNVNAASQVAWFMSGRVFYGDYSTTNPYVRFDLGRGELVNGTGGTIDMTANRETWLPVPQRYPGANPASFDVTVLYNGAASFNYLIIRGYTL